MHKALILIISVFLWCAVSLAEVGLVTEVSGQVEIEKSGLAKKKAKEGQILSLEDKVHVGKSSLVQIVFSNENAINVSGPAKFFVKSFETREDDGGEYSLINLLYGHLRAMVTKTYKKENENFQIQTKGAVVGVRGTEFIVEATESAETTVSTLEGEVLMGESLEGRKIRRAEKVRKGFERRKERGKRLGKASKIKESRLKLLNQRSKRKARREKMRELRKERPNFGRKARARWRNEGTRSERVKERRQNRRRQMRRPPKKKPKPPPQ